MHALLHFITLVLLVFFLAGCSPEIGSERWCKKMETTPKGEWTLNSAKVYAENCVFRKTE